MTTTRVLVVSDTHLSDRTPEAVANWRAVVDHITTTRPDVVVHAGDVTADAPNHPSDLDVAAAEIEPVRERIHCIPGNHDVGDNPQVSRERLDGYRDKLGADRWGFDVPGWRLVGINAQLFGSGLDEEEDQWRSLGAALPDGQDRVVLFVHKPLAPTPTLPSDSTRHRYVPPTDAVRLRDLMRRLPFGVVVSGHAHQYAEHTVDGVKHVWAPSTWAVIPDRFQPRLGEKVCGVVEVTLGSDGTARAGLQRPAGLIQQALVDDVPDPYDESRT